jgi:hypothetical protein
VVSARSNFSWCVTRPAQAAAEQIVADIQSLTTNGQLLSVEGPSGPLLMLVGPQTRPNAGLHPGYFPWLEGKLQLHYHELVMTLFIGYVCSPRHDPYALTLLVHASSVH